MVKDDNVRGSKSMPLEVDYSFGGTKFNKFSYKEKWN